MGEWQWIINTSLWGIYPLTNIKEPNISEGRSMQWLEKLMIEENCSKYGQPKKLFQTKISRQIADDFKVMCIEIGKSQKEVIEEILDHTLTEYSEAKGNA